MLEIGLGLERLLEMCERYAGPTFGPWVAKALFWLFVFGVGSTLAYASWTFALKPLLALVALWRNTEYTIEVLNLGIYLGLLVVVTALGLAGMGFIGRRSTRGFREMEARHAEAMAELEAHKALEQECIALEQENIAETRRLIAMIEESREV